MIEKILEKLEDYKYSHLVEHDSERIEHCKEQEGHCEGSDCFLCIWDRAIEIVQEVAKEYGKDTNVRSNGWIPCSERLPSREEYKKCNGQFIVSDGNRTYATYFDIYDTLKFGEPTMTKFKIDRCVIAWQPLPAPYQKGE